MLNIVIPMAGRGSRFSLAGYENPKPLIDVAGHAMIEMVIRNITPNCNSRFIFICQREHMEKYSLEKMLRKAANDCIVIPIDYITEGAACTVLLAERYIDSMDPLMIANSDQFVDADINLYLNAMTGYDGLIMTMPADHPKWSYIRYNDEKLVTEVREKEVISDQATVGIYNYSHGSDFVHCAHQMIEKDIRVNNEFYVAPVYNELINAGKKITYYDIGNRMHGLGTPEDLNQFLETSICKEFWNE